jgi:hypothetical protein
MTKIIDVNRHGIRREIDHQYKPKKKNKKKHDKSIDISIENTINVRDRKE